MARALDNLETARLVDLKRTDQSKQYEGFTLLRDDGTEKPYLVPGRDERSHIVLPAAFFFNGWHLVLKPAEVAVLLGLLDLTRRHPTGGDTPYVALSARLRSLLYGLSGEAYGAVHELVEFGIIELHDPMPNRRRGKLRTSEARDESDESSLAPVPYQFRFRSDPFDEPAWDVVSEALHRSELPPRLDELAGLLAR